MADERDAGGCPWLEVILFHVWSDESGGNKKPGSLARPGLVGRICRGSRLIDVGGANQEGFPGDGKFACKFEFVLSGRATTVCDLVPGVYDFTHAERENLLTAEIGDGQNRAADRSTNGDGITHTGIRDRHMDLSPTVVRMAGFNRAFSAAGNPENAIKAVSDAAVAVGGNQGEIFRSDAGETHAYGIFSDAE